MQWMEWTEHEVSAKTGRILRPEHAHTLEKAVILTREVPVGVGCVARLPYLWCLWACEDES